MNVAELKRQVEYKFAPEPLLAVQALANTYDFEAHDRGEELLDSPDAVRGWLLTSGLAAPTVEVGEEDRDRLITFRDAIRLMLEANSHGQLSKADLTELKGLAERYPVPLDAGPGGRLELDLAPQDSVDGVIAQLLGIAFRSQLAGEWERLKICASDECRWAFFDASRNRGGTWCQMEVCGNRVKNRAYRKRQSKSARS